MNELELRQMIREAIARHNVAQGFQPPPGGPAAPGGAQVFSPASHGFSRFPLLRSGDDAGACLIEPSVRCNHCGYCLSYGH